MQLVTLSFPGSHTVRKKLIDTGQSHCQKRTDQLDWRATATNVTSKDSIRYFYGLSTKTNPEDKESFAGYYLNGYIKN